MNPLCFCCASVLGRPKAVEFGRDIPGDSEWDEVSDADSDGAFDGRRAGAIPARIVSCTVLRTVSAGRS